MKKTRIWIAAGLLVSAVGCGLEEPSAEQSEQQSGLAARVKAADPIVAATDTATVTDTATATQTETVTATVTATQTQTATGNTITKAATARFLNVTGTAVGTVTLRNDYVGAKPFVWTATLTRLETAPTTFTGTGTATGTVVDSGITYTGSGTTTSLMQFSGFAAATATKTVSAFYSGALSKTMVDTGTGYGWMGNITWTYSKTATGTHIDTVTRTQTQTVTVTHPSTTTGT